jgi:hypothetical protein
MDVHKNVADDITPEIVRATSTVTAVLTKGFVVWRSTVITQGLAVWRRDVIPQIIVF